MAMRLQLTVLVLMLMNLSDGPYNNTAAASRITQPSDNPERGVGESPSGENRHNFIVADWKEYSTAKYGFSIRYPNTFVVQMQDVSKLPPFTPKPIVSIFFMNPGKAQLVLSGIEPPDMEVRLYQATGVDSLKSWLVLVGFVNSGTLVKEYIESKFTGLEVCQSTMIFPGCSVYALHKDFVYQLTPISQEGEAMIETFMLLP